VNFLSQSPTVMSSAAGRFADSPASSRLLRKTIKTWALALASGVDYDRFGNSSHSVISCGKIPAQALRIQKYQ
jgi:hypothetical protein